MTQRLLQRKGTLSECRLRASLRGMCVPFNSRKTVAFSQLLRTKALETSPLSLFHTPYPVHPARRLVLYLQTHPEFNHFSSFTAASLAQPTISLPDSAPTGGSPHCSLGESFRAQVRSILDFLKRSGLGLKQLNWKNNADLSS